MADDDTTTRRNALTPRAFAGAATRSWRSVVAAAAIAAMSLGAVSTASAAKRAAPVNLQIESGIGSLSASWAVTRTAGLAGFSVRWRPLTAPASAWGKRVLLAAKARSYVIEGLGPAAYEVRVFSIVAASHGRMGQRKKRTRISGGSTSAAAMALGTGEEPPILEPPRDQATEESARAKERSPALAVGKAEHPIEKAVEAPREPPSKKPPAKEPPRKEPPLKNRLSKNRRAKNRPPKNRPPKNRRAKNRPPKNHPSKKQLAALVVRRTARRVATMRTQARNQRP